MLQRRKRTTFRTIARIIFAIFAASIVAGGIGLSKLDVNSLKADIVHALEASTGLPVEINGQMSWKLSLRPMIHINDVRVQNEKWAKNKYAVRIPEMLVQINLVSLIRGSPAIQYVKMIRPVANIEENKKGEWAIRRMQREVRIPQVLKAYSPFPVDLDFGVGALELDRPEIAIISPGGTKSIMPDRIKVSLQSKGDTMEFAGQLVIGGVNYPFMASLYKFNAARKVYPARLAIAGDVAPMAVSFTLDSNKIPKNVNAEGQMLNLPALGKSLGMELPKVAKSDINIAATVNKKVINIRKLEIKSKESDVTLSGNCDFSKQKPKFNLSVTSGNFYLKEFFPELYKENQVWVHPGRPLNVFKDIPLYGELFALFDADVDIKLGRGIAYRDMDILNATAAVNLKDARAVIDADARFMGGRTRIRLVAHADEDGRLYVRSGGFGRGVIVGSIMESLYYSDIVSDLPMNLDFYLRANGRDMSEMMQSFTGVARAVSSGGGYAHEQFIDAMYGRDFIMSIKEGVEEIFSEDKNNGKRMRIGCAVANIKVRNGSIDMDRNIAVQTRAVNMRVIGNLDLGNETMAVSLNTIPADGLKLSLSGNVANSMEFIGNMAEPDLSLNGKAVAGKLATAAGVGIAVSALTGGIGLLVGAGAGLIGSDMIQNWWEDENPCRYALKDGAPKSIRGDPEFMSQPIDRLLEQFLGDAMLSR